jgi:hypothetical protein
VTEDPARSAEAADRPARPSRRPRWLYARVLLVQAVTLLALWWLQASFG